MRDEFKENAHVSPAHERMICKQLESSPVCDLGNAPILPENLSRCKLFGFCKFDSQCLPGGPPMSVQERRQETVFKIKARRVPPQRSAEIQKHRDVVGHRGQELRIQNTTRKSRAFRILIDEMELHVSFDLK